MKDTSGANVALVIETLYQIAADPEGWEQLIEVLALSSGEEAPAGVAPDLERMADIARLVSRGASSTPRSDVAWAVLSAAGRVLGCNPSAQVVMASGLGRLAHLLLAAGATEVYPSLRGAPPVSDAAGVARIPGYLTRGGASLMTVHLFSTVPIGSDRAGCPADSFGRLRGLRNVRVNDAAMLPDAPGVNPQGTVMALDRKSHV